MNQLRFFGRLLRVYIGRLCRNRALLVILLVLCLCLPLCVSPAADQIFSRGVDFSGITLAVTAPEGDSIPTLLEELLGSMQDVRQYCQVQAMDYQEALDSLRLGKVNAILSLPEGFVSGVMYGENPDVDLIVAADRPLESLLTLWVGQSAADLLSAVQYGIYQVLDIYQVQPPEGLSYNQVVEQINLRYISWTLNRQEMFRVESISVTGALPIGLHYALSILCFLNLAIAPFFYRLFDGPWLASQRRLLSVGKRPAICCFSALVVCWAVQSCVLFVGSLLICKGSVWICLLSALLCGMFCAGFTGLCCLIAPELGSCGVLTSMSALVFLFVSGGILPPVMLPQQIRQLSLWSPISWMRNLQAFSADYGEVFKEMLLIIGTAAIFCILCFLLYRRRFFRKEAGL